MYERHIKSKEKKVKEDKEDDTDEGDNTDEKEEDKEEDKYEDWDTEYDPEYFNKDGRNTCIIIWNGTRGSRGKVTLSLTQNITLRMENTSTTQIH